MQCVQKSTCLLAVSIIISIFALEIGKKDLMLNTDDILWKQ